MKENRIPAPKNPETYYFRSEPPMALPVRVEDRASAAQKIRKLYDSKALNKQSAPNNHAAKYRSSYGPCAVGAVIPDAIAEWIDAGNVVEARSDGYHNTCYVVNHLVDAGVLEFSTPEEEYWFTEIQAEHDAKRWDDFETSLTRVGA